jgi:hypothetical protein
MPEYNGPDPVVEITGVTEVARDLVVVPNRDGRICTGAPLTPAMHPYPQHQELPRSCRSQPSTGEQNKGVQGCR